MDSDTLARIEAAARAGALRHGWLPSDSVLLSGALPHETRRYIATMDPATALALVEYVRRLERAARAVVDRWNTPSWKDAGPTARVIYELRDAIGGGE